MPEDTDSTVAEIGDDKSLKIAPKTTWIWLPVGLIAGCVACLVAVVIESEFPVPMPAEYDAIANTGPMGSNPPEADAMQITNRTDNLARMLYGFGATMAIVFGWAAGVIYGRLGWGLLGVFLGVGVAVLLSILLGPQLAVMENAAVTKTMGGEMKAIYLHAAQGILIGLSVVIAIGVVTRSVLSTVKVFGVVVMAGIVGSVIYVIGGALIDPTVSVAHAQPHAGKLWYVWHLLTPTLTGLFLSRSQV